MPKQKRHWILRPLFALGSFLLWLVSIKSVREYVAKRLIDKGQEKIVDAKAKILKDK